MPDFQHEKDASLSATDFEKFRELEISQNIEDSVSQTGIIKDVNTLFCPKSKMIHASGIAQSYKQDLVLGLFEILGQLFSLIEK